ncbi:hypothetical protein KDL01_25030 [Actinospica durhamensis]|uniref:Uncharacterized protein n=1 Tax=Actinospica durhamensis TaxID=1508375 RepID=A0A941ERB9_9ACTN|nr:hypothetical protein [Actinospica durhamensis]MBR7836567.1 hypothetical protein [Actinospica durhamensis]
MTSKEDEDDGDAVFCRALCQGTWSGALTGALGSAVILANAQTQPGTPVVSAVGGTVAATLVFGAIGYVVGALLGFTCALIPACVLALAAGFFRRHERLALLGPAVAGLALQILVLRWDTEDTAFEMYAIFSMPAAIGTVLAMAATPYALTGRGFRLRLPRIAGLPRGCRGRACCRIWRISPE